VFYANIVFAVYSFAFYGDLIIFGIYLGSHVP